MRVYYLYVTSVKVYEELSHVLHVAELEVQDVPFDEVSTVPVVGLGTLLALSGSTGTPVQELIKIKNLLFP